MGATRGAGKSTAEERDFFVPDLCAPYSVLVMVLLSEVLVVVHVLAESTLPRIDWALLANGSLSVQIVVLLSAALLCQLRRPLNALSLPTATVCCLLVVVAVTLCYTFIFQRYVALQSPGLTSWHLLQNALLSLVIAAVVLRYFYLQQQLRLREQLELQARMDSLRDRIRPHFLFNTLNSIASLIGSRPEDAERAVEDLSELFRMSLRDDRGDTTVADELRLCDLYLGIEKLRLGERLRVDWNVTQEARRQPMPGLILQPLVENAVYHGVSRIPAGGVVRVSVDVQENRVVAIVENPVPTGARAAKGHQMALENVNARLEAIYGAGAGLEIAPAEDSFHVTVSYPLETVV